MPSPERSTAGGEEGQRIWAQVGVNGVADSPRLFIA